MDDLISRQAAIEALEQIRYALWEIDIPSPTVPEYIEHHRDVQNVMKRIDEIRDKMERLPSAQPEHRWIPCSERLPEFDVKVLAYVKNKDPEGRFNKDGIYTATLEDKVPVHDPEGKKNFWGIPGYDSEWTVWSWSYFTEPNVLAWMPLPEPYKEGEHETDRR